MVRAHLLSVVGCFVVGMSAGCAMDDPPIAETQQEIINGTAAAPKAATVFMYLDFSGSPVYYICHGTVLTEHWLLTAAHCLGGNNPGSGWVTAFTSTSPDGHIDATVYDGPADYFIHPQYTGGANGGNYDFLLVHLDWLNVGVSDRAKLWQSLSSRPWRDNSLGKVYTHSEGAGTGQWPFGVNSECQNQPEDTMRYYLARAKANNDLYADLDSNRHCKGDSGGTFAFVVNDTCSQTTQYVQYGVYDQTTFAAFKIVDRARIVTPQLGWLEGVMAGRVFLSATTRNVCSGGSQFPYRAYGEQTKVGALTNGNNWCLMASGDVDGAGVYLEPCDGSPAQTWEYRADGRIRNVGWDRCMDVTWGALATAGCSGILEQRFRWDQNAIHLGTDYYQCIDLPWGNQYAGAWIGHYDCFYNPAQTWSWL